MEFYGKTLEKTEFSFWYRAIGDRPLLKIKRALLDYTRQGKFAPKPVHILELIDANTSQDRSKQALPKPPESNCPQDIADAWAWFIRMNSGYAFGPQTSPTPEKQDEYIHTVNREAFRLNNPESIPKEYKIKEIWT
jgi:hypothetical protein